MNTAPARPNGLPLAVAAYTIWGFLPLFFALLRQVPPFELVAWRVIFTVPLCVLFIGLRRQAGEILAVLRDWRVLRLLLVSALLIGSNWVIYVAAVNGGHVFAASLGYYINPLLNVLLGTAFLSERLSRLQWLAVTVAFAGVAVLLAGATDTLGISLALAITFGLYGLVRKLAPVGSVPGLTIESAVLLLPAAGCALWFAQQPAGSSFGSSPGASLILGASGAVTAVPLLLFAVAARRMDYSTLGFVQFLAPTIAFILGLVVFHEPLRPVQLASFVVIWIAIGLFSFDLLRRRSAAVATTRSG
ncbi:MAG: EamA family transporter RarD [Novosphingobium sp.]